MGLCQPHPALGSAQTQSLLWGQAIHLQAGQDSAGWAGLGAVLERVPGMGSERRAGIQLDEVQ